MPKRALVEHRPYLVLSLIFAITYFLVMDGQIGGAWLALWKGAGVGFLAIYATHRGQGRDAALIAIFLTLSAIADVAIEFNFMVGGAIFGLAHLVAIGLYLINPRVNPTGTQRAAALGLLLFTPAIAALLTYPLANWHLVALYALIVGAMAASAWKSRFPRYRVGTGAVLFVVSDLVIFAREAGQMTTGLADWLVWPLYFTAQFLIAIGVIQTTRRDAELT